MNQTITDNPKSKGGFSDKINRIRNSGLTPSNKTALITGASSGLGAEFAIQLAALGYNLILVARRENRLEQLAETVQSKYNVAATILPADLSLIPEIDQVISVIKTTPNLEILVNNAGFGIARRFVHVPPERVLSLLNVHLTASVMLCRAALPGMLSRNIGAVINVSSLAGIVPVRSVLYGTSKSFLINFSETLHEELGATNVRIQALCPGFIYTEFHDTPQFARFRRESIPRFLWMEPDEVVSASLKALQGKKVICIPGKFYGLVGALARNSITANIIKIAARIVLRRRK